MTVKQLNQKMERLTAPVPELANRAKCGGGWCRDNNAVTYWLDNGKRIPVCEHCFGEMKSDLIYKYGDIVQGRAI